jgi:MGT family glycosyltransferase
MHVAIVAAAAPSHMHPHLAVVRELVRRGHRVSYLVGQHLSELAADTGADVVGCTSVLPGAPAVTGWPDDAVAGMRMFLDEAVHVLPQVHAALDHDRPDVLLYDIGGMAGPVAAARWGIPAVQLSPSMVAWDGYQDDMAEALAPMLASPGYHAYREAFDDWLAGSDLSFDDVTGVPARCLVLIPRVMQPNSSRVGDRYRFVGPCIDPRRAAPGDWQEPAGDGPLILVAFGTSYTRRPDVYRNVIDALDGMGWRMVLATGGRVTKDELGAIPNWVRVEEVVPQVAVLHRADAFVTHAGMGSCTEALWCGVPTVAVPQAVDQFGNADQLVTLGVGVHLAADLPSADELRAGIVDITDDPDVRSRLDAIRAELRRDCGPDHAADAVEAVAAGSW